MSPNRVCQPRKVSALGKGSAFLARCRRQLFVLLLGGGKFYRVVWPRPPNQSRDEEAVRLDGCY